MSVQLQQSAGSTVTLGPFQGVGSNTPYVGADIGGADQAYLLKAGGLAAVALGGTLSAIADCDGWYHYTFAEGEDDTIGELTVVLQSNADWQPVHGTFQVVKNPGGSRTAFLKTKVPIRLRSVLSSRADKVITNNPINLKPGERAVCAFDFSRIWRDQLYDMELPVSSDASLTVVDTEDGERQWGTGEACMAKFTLEVASDAIVGSTFTVEGAVKSSENDLSKPIAVVNIIDPAC